MDIYISKNCPHCKKLLLIFYNNKHLIQYFNIMDIETNPYPNFITSVPTLVYNGELYFDEKMHALIDNVNQHHIRENGPQEQQQNNQGKGQGKGKGKSGQQQDNQGKGMSPQKSKGMPGPPQGTQEQGINSDGMRNPNMNQGSSDKQDFKSEKGPANDDVVDGIMGMCMGEDCLYENINDDKGFNNINQNYCFLDDDMDNMNKSNAPAKLETNSSEKESSKFDNSAYEEMMKNRGGM